MDKDHADLVATESEDSVLEEEKWPLNYIPRNNQEANDVTMSMSDGYIPSTQKRLRKSPGHLDVYQVGLVDSKVATRDIIQLNIRIPITLKEAMNGPQKKEWSKAVGLEFGSIRDKKTYALVDLPKGRKALGCKWVFDVKYQTDGSIDRYKARLVVQGFKQIPGIDFDEVFAPVARIESLAT